MTLAPTQEREPHYRLLTLGRLALLTPRGEDEDLSKRRRKLALLTVLALSPRALGRDTLVDMFWGEEPEDRARHSLSDALSHLRRVLGKDAISARQADIELSANVQLAVDAREFTAACKAQDWERAVAAYSGPFLNGIIIDRSPRFEQWSADIRERLRRSFEQACSRRCATLAASADWPTAAEIAERWLEAAPESADAACHLMHARSAAGTPGALRDALSAYDRIARRLSAEQDAPDGAVVELAREIRERLAALTSAEPAHALEPAVSRGRHEDSLTPAAVAAGPAIQASRTPWGWRGRTAVASAAVVLFAAALWPAMRNRAQGQPSPERPVVVVTSIHNTSGDTSTAWLAEGLRQMLAAGLDRGGRIDVVPATRLRDALARRNWTRDAGDSARNDAAELDAARSLGATWAVRGNVTLSEGVYLLDVTVSETGSRRSVSTFSVTGQSLIGVADQTASRVRSLAAETAAGPYLADVETGSDDALQQYIRAEQANVEGRYTEGARALDAAIALDSSFPSAIMERLRLERANPASPLIPRLAALYERAKPRLNDWDRLEQAAYYAFHNGEHTRAERLATALVQRYPFDPRAYVSLADVLAHHGKWSAADSVYLKLLALDSLAIASGDGPCVPCHAFSGLVDVLEIAGDLRGAEAASRRWIALQPDSPKAWADLASALEFDGRFDAALDAERRAVALSNGEREFEVRLGRILIAARRFDAADSAIATLQRSGGALERPRSICGSCCCVSADSIGRRFDCWRRGPARPSPICSRRKPRPCSAGRKRRWGVSTRCSIHRPAAPSRCHPSCPSQAMPRETCRWLRALEADALWQTADTVFLKGLADTIERVSSRSYYGRDWNLHHHVRGLVDLRAGRYGDAMRELAQARWGVSGWTRTLAAYADAALAANRAADALPVLRDAYRGPLDAMGRYLPRSEIDVRMAQAFGALGMRDSAARYVAYVQSAWRDADPEWKRRALELGVARPVHQ